MASSFIDTIMEGTVEFEAPRRYYYWSAMAALSAVARKNVYLERGGLRQLTVFPNIYVLLVGDSGIKKGPPIELVKDLVRQVGNTRVIAGRGSIQGILQKLGTSRTREDGSMDKGAAGFITSGEFSQSLVKDDAALTILTDLYDGQYNTERDNLLKSEEITLRDVCVTMLSGSNEVHLMPVIGKRDMEGGFMARTMIVYDNEPNCINDLMDEPKVTVDTESLVKYLKEVSKLKGQFILTTDFKEVYRPWYRDFATSKKDMGDKTGTVNRLGDHVIKVSMLLSLSRGLDLRLTGQDAEQAIALCLDCLANSRKILLGSDGISDIAAQSALLLDALMKAPEMTLGRQRILQRYWKDIDNISLNKVIESFLAADIISVGRIPGGDIGYTLKSHIAEQYNKFRKEIH